MIILAGCCGGMLAAVIGHAAPLRVENNAVVIRVPSHVILQNLLDSHLILRLLRVPFSLRRPPDVARYV